MKPTTPRRAMKIVLAHRHYGVHTDVRETEVPGEFGDYVTPRPGATRDVYVIDENKLLSALPPDFLPARPGSILLAVTDDRGGTGQTGLSHFRNWAKYFDAYCLNLIKPESSTAEGGVAS